jgi:hypothetical protein
MKTKYGREQVPNKQLHLAGYLFECCYDLAISPDRNASQNPGFESFLGEFGNGQV